MSDSCQGHHTTGQLRLTQATKRRQQKNNRPATAWSFPCYAVHAFVRRSAPTTITLKCTGVARQRRTAIVGGRAIVAAVPVGTCALTTVRNAAPYALTAVITAITVIARTVDRKGR